MKKSAAERGRAGAAGGREPRGDDPRMVAQKKAVESQADERRRGRASGAGEVRRDVRTHREDEKATPDDATPAGVSLRAIER